MPGALFSSDTSSRGYVMFANSDMFLWKSFSVSEYMGRTSCSIAGIMEIHQSLVFLHPSFHIIDPVRTPDVRDIRWDYAGSDVGGATRFWLQTHPSACVHPMMWSRHIDVTSLAKLRLVPLELKQLLDKEKGQLSSDLYLEAFQILHLRGGSNWQKEAVGALETKFKQYFEFLTARLENKPLTWSKEASVVLAGGPPIASKNVVYGPTEIVLKQEGNRRTRKGEGWLDKLFEETDAVKAAVATKKARLDGEKLPLPPPARARTNLQLAPPRYDHSFYVNSTVYYWKYVYNETTPERPAPFTATCQKKPGQKYWVATYGSGPKRARSGKTKTIPSCRSHVDHAVFWTDTDMDPEYRRRNTGLLNQTHGAGLWIWKHYVILAMLERADMNDGDILFYLDSDMGCSRDTKGFFCLADNAEQDVIPFHHNHPWYSLSRLARRDAMVFMGLDSAEVAQSVQYSGGNIFIKKSAYSVKWAREMAAWSQQPEVIMGWRMPSEFAEDWPEYLESNMMHQCDQAISSLMHVKYGHKSYPWLMEGFGGGSNDMANVAERVEAGIPLSAKINIPADSVK